MANETSNLKRPLLYALIVSVILGAVLGIIVVLRNEWGWFETRVILTTVVVAIASLCGLACDLSKTPRGLNLLPKSGLALTGVSALIILIGMWIEFEEEWYWKMAASISIFGVATVHVCLLSIAKLIRRFQWVFFIAWQAIFGLAALLVVIIIAEIDSEELMRLVAVASIVIAALTLVIPMLHRIGRMDANNGDLLMPVDQRTVVSIDTEIAKLQKKIVMLEKLRVEVAGEPTNKPS
jgi:hypothetical protein